MKNQAIEYPPARFPAASHRRFSRDSVSPIGVSRGSPHRVFFFILFHIPLVFLFRWNAIFPTIHALIIIGVGFLWLLRDQRPHRLIYLVAYITGAELLWRVTEANVFWELGKYAISFFFILAMFKYQLLSRADKWPVFYFALLIPSVFLLPRFDREAIAFNLAGPFALAVATMFFSSITINRNHMQRVLIALIAPAVGLAALAMYGIITTDSLMFAAKSLKMTSAGYGPNQVSSILGLGALAAFFCAILEKEHRFQRLFMVVIVVWLVAQAALTFSRGGVWTTIGAIAVAAFYLIRDRRTRSIFALSSAFVFLIGYFLIFPILNNFTGGLLETRFRSFDTTGRGEIIQADLMAFRAHPLLGLGPGQSKPYHVVVFRVSNPHTEFSRMLAEHGSLGLLALLILLRIAAQRFLVRRSPVVKAYKVSFTAWAFLFMYHAATRLVAPSFMFGLASATFLFDSESVETKTSQRS